MSENKTKPTEESVDVFLQGVADERRRQDCQTLVQMMEEATGEPARMWGSAIIGFGNFHYKYASGREGDTMLMGFSPRKDTLAIYGVTGFDTDDGLLAGLGKHKTGKSCLYVKALRDVDTAVLKTMMQQAIQHLQDSSNET